MALLSSQRHSRADGGSTESASGPSRRPPGGPRPIQTMRSTPARIAQVEPADCIDFDDLHCSITGTSDTGTFGDRVRQPSAIPRRQSIRVPSRSPTRPDMQPASIRTSSFADNRARRASLVHSTTVADLQTVDPLPPSVSRRRTLAHASLLIPDSISTQARSRKSVAGAGKSPMRTTFPRPVVPASGPGSGSASSFAKRLSSMPHVGGLGARTISPTDARRLKRLSMAASLPGVAQQASPAAPNFSDIVMPPLSAVLPPSIANGPAVSGRSSPERRSGGPLTVTDPNIVRTASSRASYIALSRLSAPKTQIHSAHPPMPTPAPLDDVPPVPAIPKAYESPKDGLRMFAAAIELIPGKIPPSAKTPPSPAPPAPSQNRRMSRVEPPGEVVNKRTLQPLRLPPLNLLPLNDRVRPLPKPVDVDRTLTPPPRRGNVMTPSTPLTASKATFARTDGPDGSSRPPVRAVTADFTSAATTAPAPAPMPVPQNRPAASTPFSASSARMARMSLDPDPLPVDGLDVRAEEPPTPTSASSSRRPSFGWKRSSSKAGPPRSEVEAGPAPVLSTPGRLHRLSTASIRPAPTRNRAAGSSQESVSRVVSASRPVGSSGESRMPRPRSSATGMRPSTGPGGATVVPIPLDRDLATADRMMERLGARREEVEIAARELDQLQARAAPVRPLPAAEALDRFPLNIFERGEIVDFDHVYFTGTESAVKHVGDLAAKTDNFGYDDERGDYRIVVGDHLAYRYEVVDVLGKGSFGQVVRCVDHKLGKLVAVKIIRNKKRFHQQALVEVNILQKLHDWDPDHQHSTIRFTQSFYFRGHLCISTELLGINLYEFIKAHNFHGFSLTLIRRFAVQILNALVLLQSRRVIHCDLKPENILLCHPTRSEIKVIDFGSSCFEHEKVYTYIQSRFYRSPEVILGITYGISIDMWSLGCILTELLTGYPLFPGENEQEQLACIMEIFGPPEKHLIEKSNRRKLFFDSLGKPRTTVSSKGRRRRPSSRTLQQALKCEDEPFIDFISRCLRWDPSRRMKPDEAIQHEFITGIRAGRPTPRGRFPLVPSPTVGLPASSSPTKRGPVLGTAPTVGIGIGSGSGPASYGLPTRASASRAAPKPTAVSMGGSLGPSVAVGSGPSGYSSGSRHLSIGRPLPDPPTSSGGRLAVGSGTSVATGRSPAKGGAGHSRRHSAINMLGGMLKGSSNSTGSAPAPAGNSGGRSQRVAKSELLGNVTAPPARV